MAQVPSSPPNRSLPWKRAALRRALFGTGGVAVTQSQSLGMLGPPIPTLSSFPKAENRAGHSWLPMRRHYEEDETPALEEAAGCHGPCACAESSKAALTSQGQCCRTEGVQVCAGSKVWLWNPGILGIIWHTGGRYAYLCLKNLGFAAPLTLNF